MDPASDTPLFSPAPAPRLPVAGLNLSSLVPSGQALPRDVPMTKTATKPALPAGALGRLRAQLDFLSPSLRRVAEFTLEQPEGVVYQTITELASAAEVGEASITRLSHKLGFPGFHAFKLALTADLAAQNQLAGPAEAESLPQIIESATRQAVAAMEDTRAVVDPLVAERAVRRLAEASRVDVTGQGHSALAAEFLSQKLMRLGITTLAHPDPHVAAVLASTLPEGGVMVAFTRSGSTLDTIQNLRLARAAGAYTLAVTHRASSPVTQHADDVLYTASPEGPLAGGAISSLVSQLLVVEVLFLGVLKQLGRADDYLLQTAAAVGEKKV